MYLKGPNYMKLSKMILLSVIIILTSCRSNKIKTQEKQIVDSTSKSEIKTEKNIFNTTTDSGIVITEEIIEYKSDSIFKTPVISKRTIKSIRKYNVKATHVAKEKYQSDTNVSVKKESELKTIKKEPIKNPIINKISYFILIILILLAIGYYIYKKI